MASVYYRNLLNSELRRRQRQNSRYSLRAFAKQLEIEPATLSRVLANKESLSFRSSEKIFFVLNVDEKKKRLFLESLAREKAERRITKSMAGVASGETSITQDQFHVISKWYHYALLELTLTKDFDSRPSAIAQMLGIDVIEAKDAIQRLIRLNLLKLVDGQLTKTSGYVTTTDGTKTSEGLREFSRTMLQMAARSVDKDAFDERAVFGVTMAIDPELIPVARQMFEQASKEILAALTSDKQVRVYQLQMALFPVQRPTKQIDYPRRVLQ